LTGFDSGLRWYVSMRSEDCVLHNPFGQKINWRGAGKSEIVMGALRLLDEVLGDKAVIGGLGLVAARK